MLPSKSVERRLSVKIKRIKQERTNDPKLGEHLQFETTQHLLERLKLPQDVLRKAKGHEAHSIRIGETRGKIGRNEPVKKQTLMGIFERVITEQEAQSRKLEKSDPKIAKELGNRKKMFQGLLDIVRAMNTEFILIEPQLKKQMSDVLTEALYSHLYELREILGERKFNPYIKAIQKARGIILRSRTN